MQRIVIGGGMSGMVTALCSARAGHKTVLLERNNRLGKKVAMTGNGRCNIGNINCDSSCYNGSGLDEFVFDSVDVTECVDFLNSVGIFTFADDEGRIYPITESSNSVVDCLRYALQRAGVEVVCDCTAKEVVKQSDGFAVICSDKRRYADDVVVAIGSGSQAEMPFVKGIEDFYTALCPSLVPLKVNNMDKTLNGIRVKCNVRLLKDGNVAAEEKGELLFREYGLSGICAFDLSAVIARRTVKGDKSDYGVLCDLVPHMPYDILVTVIKSRLASQCGREELLYGIVHNKIAQHVLKRVDDLCAEKIARVLKNCLYSVSLIRDYGKSQVTSGGLDGKYCPRLRLPNGIGAVGEVLDVDGKCGGYNLMFAIASALTYCKLYNGEV